MRHTMRMSIHATTAVFALLIFSETAKAEVASSSAEENEIVNRNAESSLISEIVVTAQRREQRLQDVGISVTAFSGEQMTKLGFSSAADIASQAPNVEVRRHFVSRGLTTNLFIRGVGQTNFNSATEGSVAGFVDDFYLASSSTLDFLLFDMGHAEVLRGPQGTLFGRNATGGAFQYFTAKPELGETSGSIKLGYGTFNQRIADGYINVPISDKAAIRISGTFDKFDHMAENIFPGKGGQLNGDFRALRGQFLFKPNDNLTIQLKAETGTAKGNLTADHGRGFDLLDTLAGKGDVIPVDVDGFGYTPEDDGPNKFNANGFNYGYNTVDHYLGRVEWDFGDVVFTSITGYMKQYYELAEDCDGSPTPFCNYNPVYRSRQFSQEFRLNGDSNDLTWALGAYYLNHKANADTIVPVLVGLVPATDPNKLGALGLLIDFDQKLVSKAVFGQVEYDVTNQLTAIFGIRYNHDVKDFEQILRFATLDYNTTSPNFNSITEMRNFIVTGDADTPNIFTRQTVGDLTRLSEKDYGMTAQLNWKPADDILLYLSFRRGIKGGGFNNEVMPVSLPADKIPYKGERLNAYEFGWKTTLPNGRARLNGAVFYYDYKNYQAVSFQDFGNFQQNADASLYGGELEVTLNPVDGLDLVAGGAYLHSKVKDITRPGGYVLDTEMGEAPKFSFNALARYTVDVRSIAGELAFQVDGNYTGKRYADVLNQSGLELDAYAVVNALISYQHESGNWGIDAYVKNLFDKRVETFKLEIDNLAGTMNGQVNYNPRRTAAVTVTYRF